MSQFYPCAKTRNGILLKSFVFCIGFLFTQHVFAQQPFIFSFTPTSGSVGTPVTISGKGFNYITGVSFGGVPASDFIVQSSGQIIAMPAVGASGDVVVTSLNGTATLSGFTYVNPTLPPS